MLALGFAIADLSTSYRIGIIELARHIGDIEIAKPPGEHLTPAEDALLIDLAAQAGLAMHNVRLAASLELRLAELDER